jgi:hypothetical protein
MLPFFQWCYDTWIGAAIRESTWLFPLIEAFHLVGLGLTAGTVLTVDLRLLGVGLSRQSAAQLWASVQPWFLGSLSLMFVTGILLFMSESIKCYYSFAFWIKMASLLLAIVFAFTIRRHVVRAGPMSGAWRQGRLTALTSLVLWFGVAWGGRWIGFS